MRPYPLPMTTKRASIFHRHISFDQDLVPPPKSKGRCRGSLMRKKLLTHNSPWNKQSYDPQKMPKPFECKANQTQENQSPIKSKFQ